MENHCTVIIKDRENSTELTLNLCDPSDAAQAIIWDLLALLTKSFSGEYLSYLIKTIDEQTSNLRETDIPECDAIEMSKCGEQLLHQFTEGEEPFHRFEIAASAIILICYGSQKHAHLGEVGMAWRTCTRASHLLGCLKIKIMEYIIKSHQNNSAISSRADQQARQNFKDFIVNNNVVISKITDLWSIREINAEWLTFQRGTLKKWYKEAMPNTKLKGGRPK